MGTAVIWEGNIGNAPEYKSFPNGNKDPRRLLRLNVYFDNSIRRDDGSYEDKGGFWANVEWWHRDAEHYADLFQKGMRVLVDGRAVMDQWQNGEGEEQAAMKVQANRVAILPPRIDSIVLGQSKQPSGQRQGTNTSQQAAPAQGSQDHAGDFDSDIPFS